MKTFKEWSESDLNLDIYLQVGDPVDEEMADYFVNVFPPATMNGYLIQVGEPVSEVDGKPTFATLQKIHRQWIYRGGCFRGHCAEPRGRA